MQEYAYLCSVKMNTRFKKNTKVFDIMVTAVSGTLSVAVMLYAVYYFGLEEAWSELILNTFYIACLAMIWMYFFIFIIDALIATFYNFDVMFYESIDEYSNYMLTEIWIRPAISYGLVACFVTESEEDTNPDQ